MRVGWIGAASIATFLVGCPIGPGGVAASASQASSTSTAPGHAQAIAAAFDEYLHASVEHDHFSGAVLVAQDGVPIFSNSYGMANYELNVPITPDTVFNVGSITKQFTAMAVMQLQEQGRLNVGDPVCNYLENCPTTWQPITIRHLLTHTSGIPNYSSLPDWDERLVVTNYRHGELISLFRDLPLQFPSGTQHHYTNSGYYLLGLIVENASGMSYGRYLDERIFAPLGMAHTRFNNTRALIPNRAAGYYSLGTSFINASLHSPTVHLGNAGVYATVGDLLIWDRALYSGRLLSPESMREMFTPFLSNYAYGWRVGERFGRQQVNHSGSSQGFSSYIVRFPNDRFTVIVLSNSDRANATRVAISLAAIYFGEPYDAPRASLLDILWDVLRQEGVDAATARYHQLRRTEPSAHDFDTDETLVDLGYTLYEADLLTEAQQVFEFTLETFPRSAYSHDGLADIAALRSDYDSAIHHFATSLALDPSNDYAIRGLARVHERLPR